MRKLIEKGFTPYLCFGKYGGFHFFNDKLSCRLVLGRLSFGYFKCDMEVTVSNLIETNVELLKQLKQNSGE